MLEGPTGTLCDGEPMTGSQAHQGGPAVHWTSSHPCRIWIQDREGTGARTNQIRGVRASYAAPAPAASTAPVLTCRGWSSCGTWFRLSRSQTASAAQGQQEPPMRGVFPSHLRPAEHLGVRSPRGHCNSITRVRALASDCKPHDPDFAVNAH